MTRYTVKQLATLARISIRTLHHYDAIGLLKPAYLGNNGYRYYEQPQLQRLQQVVMYRDFGLGLDEIQAVLDAPPDAVAAKLRGHRRRLVERLQSQQSLLSVIEKTLRRIDGETDMSTYPQIWQSEEKAAEYKQWLMERYSANLDASFGEVRRRLTAMTPAQRQGIKAERETVEAALAEAFRSGMSSEALATSDALARHRDWLTGIWGGYCPPAKYASTAEVFASYKDYVDYFDSLAPGLAAWLSAGMKAWVHLGEAAAEA